MYVIFKTLNLQYNILFFFIFNFMLFSFFLYWRVKILFFYSIFLKFSIFYLFRCFWSFFFFGIFWSLFWLIFSYDSCFLLNIFNIYPFGLALFNTFLLLSSSTLAILFHLNYLNYKIDKNLYFCITLGLFFLLNQIIEFNLCFFTISNWAFCSIFFFGTGFHGFHVFVGLIFLILILFRKSIIFFVNCSLLYWHFVDVIWLFLFSFIYIFVFYLFL